MNLAKPLVSNNEEKTRHESGWPNHGQRLLLFGQKSALICYYAFVRMQDHVNVEDSPLYH